MIKVGLTGSIGSGKSAVARAAAEELGIPVFDADKTVHDLYATDKALQAFLVQTCGTDILKDGTVDRKKLTNVMKNRPAEWQAILAKVYERLWKTYDAFIAEQEEKGQKFIIADVPLLFETEAEDHFDYTINVSLPYDIQKRRALARETPKLTEEEFERRYKTFMSTEKRNKRADFVIDNSGNVEASLLQLRSHLSNMRDPAAAPALTQDFNQAAVYVGSFDPMTLGHVDVVKSASKMPYKKLYVAVGINPEKNPMFTTEERIAMIEREMDRDVRPYLAPGQEVIVTSYEGLTVDFMKKVGASLCIRGLRGVKDLEEEGDLAAVNKDLYADGLEEPGSEEFSQVYFAASHPEHRHISSSFARAICSAGRDLSLLHYVSPDVAARMIEKRELLAAQRAVSAEELKKIRALWQEFVPEGGAAADKILTRLSIKYGEAHRKYHTLQHLAEVFALFEENRASFRDPQAVALALFFHDVIYDIPGPDNEERSAAYAEKALAEMGAAPELIARVAELITMTKAHAADTNDTDAALTMDIDMAILGASAARYKKYAAAIEAEYTSHIAPDDYKAGRKQFLAACRKKERLFLTDTFEDKYGEQSRHNLTWEENHLKKKTHTACRPNGHKAG